MKSINIEKITLPPCSCQNVKKEKSPWIVLILIWHSSKYYRTCSATFQIHMELVIQSWCLSNKNAYYACIICNIYIFFLLLYVCTFNKQTNKNKWQHKMLAVCHLNQIKLEHFRPFKSSLCSCEYYNHETFHCIYQHYPDFKTNQ